MFHFQNYKIYVLCILLLASTICSAQVKDNEDVEQYFEKSTVDNKNAVYINGTDIYGSGTLYLGYQRELINSFWAEIGLGIGVRSLELDNISVINTKIMFTPYRLFLRGKEIEDVLFDFGVDDEASFNLKPTASIEVGLYKRLLGEPVASQFGMGIHSKFASYNIEYNYRYRDENFDDVQVSAANTISRTSLYLSFIYKFQISNHFGMDYTAGAGPSIMTFKKITNSTDFFSERKQTRFDGYLSLKFYYTF